MSDQAEGMVDKEHLRAFVRESNRIEGIKRPPTAREIEAHLYLLGQDRITQIDLEAFVAVVAPGKPIRDRVGMNVSVGNHRPPIGGRGVLVDLHHILEHANRGNRTPFKVHQAYETLHPFMDGNGRSGRALAGLIEHARPTNWDDDDDPEQVLAWQVAMHIAELKS